MTGLLPEGLRDRLPGEAEAQAARMRALLDAISAAGFARVSPPLAEYEEELAVRLKGARTDLARFVDPVSQRTLAIRSDFTPQIARIASTRLADAARPLRLGYAGTVLKLGTGRLGSGREAIQVGAELIGEDGVDAAIALVQTALAALEAAGVGAVTVDLTVPDLVETLLPGDPSAARLNQLLDLKDAGGLTAEGYDSWLPLLGCMGPAMPALVALAGFDRTGKLGSRIDRLSRIAEALAGSARVTLDPTERHGFEYQSWFGFSLFVPGARDAVGRGGSYAIAHPDGRLEPAIGFSIYPDALDV